MTEDNGLQSRREAWQAQRVTIPKVRSVARARDAGPDVALPHVEFLEDAIQRLRLRFWKNSERSFLTCLREQLGEGTVRLHGRRHGRRRKFKGGLKA